MMRLLRITVTPPTSVSQRNADSNGDADDEAGSGATVPVASTATVRRHDPGETTSTRPHVVSQQQSRADDKRQAIRMALDIITAVSKGLYVPESRRNNQSESRRGNSPESRRSNGHRTWRVV